MVFTSLEFLSFFPVVLCVYFLLPHAARWVFLLAASLYFLASATPLFVLPILGATVVSYYFGIRIEEAKDKPQKKKLLAVAVWLLIGHLFIFKYTGFVNETGRSVFGWFGANYPVPVLTLLLPIGISFYTFSLISYLADVHAGGMKAERHFGIFALYTSFFPKVVAGPIERAKQLLPQLHTPQKVDVDRIALGLLWMGWGFFKKAVVADRLAPFVQQVYENPHDSSGVAMTLATLLFAFQVYCDFSGYSDIALGAALTMGFKLMQNFNRPYLAISIQDFWKRWHISLTTWLTDYVYTPLTRNKNIKMKLYNLMLLALLVTFIASGIWHGAQWTFIFWGALHGSYLVLAMMTQKWRRETIKKLKLDKSPKIVRWMNISYTFVLVCFAYIFFQAASLSDAFYIATHLGTGWGSAGAHVKDFVDGRWAELSLAGFGIAVVMLADQRLPVKADVTTFYRSRPTWQRYALCYAGLTSIVLFGALYDTDQAFIYFQF